MAGPIGLLKNPESRRIFSMIIILANILANIIAEGREGREMDNELVNSVENKLVIKRHAELLWGGDK